MTTEPTREQRDMQVVRHTRAAQREDAVSEHTPGPWRVDPLNSGDVQTADGKIEICTAECQEMQFASGYLTPRTRGEAEANARLIASAPEMAAEIERLAIALSVYGEHRPTCAMQSGEVSDEFAIMGCTCGLSTALARKP